MDPDKVSDALYECETAIQSYTDRFSSHLKDRDMRHRDGEIVLEKKLMALTKSVGLTHATAVSTTEKNHRLASRANLILDSFQQGFSEASVQTEEDKAPRWASVTEIMRKCRRGQRMRMTHGEEEHILSTLTTPPYTD